MTDSPSTETMAVTRRAPWFQTRISYSAPSRGTGRYVLQRWLTVRNGRPSTRTSRPTRRPSQGGRTNSSRSRGGLRSTGSPGAVAYNSLGTNAAGVALAEPSGPAGPAPAHARELPSSRVLVSNAQGALLMTGPPVG